MLIVENNHEEVERRLQQGLLGCPKCGVRLRPWGHARRRRLRAGGTEITLRPRRAICSACAVTHVLFPTLALLRRSALAEVIGQALVARIARGEGHRRIAAALDVPATTVRGWLRAFAANAEAIRAHFTQLAHWLDPSSGPIDPRASPQGDALEALEIAAAAASRRFGETPV